MSRELDTLKLIQGSFPGSDQLVEHAFHESRPFRDLCEDYRRCVAALHRWKKSTAAEGSHRRQEYTDLMMELGHEIETWLEAMDIAPSGRGTGVRQ